MLWLYIVLGILALFAAVLLIPSDLGLEYLQQGNVQKFTVHLRILFIPIRIPLRIKAEEEAAEKKIHKTEKTKKKGKNKAEGKLTWNTFRGMVRGVQASYESIKEELKDIVHYLRRSITVKELRFHIQFGLDDPAKTGISTGAVWTGGTLLLKIVDELIGIQKIDMGVYPVFDRECFDVHIKSIFTAQLVHIINILVKILLVVNMFIHTIEQNTDNN